MSDRALKERLYEEFARIGKAIANPHRLELLDLLCQAPRTVEELAREARLTVANASQHLQVLRHARLVEARRAGSHVYYSLADEAVCRLLRQIQDLGRLRLAEVDQVVRDFFEGRDRLEPVTPRALWERLRRGEVIVLDVRPEQEYRAGHIPGARCVPLAELERRLAELPDDREIVAYCRGPYCVFAVQAVEILRRHGFRARRMQGGLPDWKLEGLPVETGGGPQRCRVPRRSRRNP